MWTVSLTAFTRRGNSARAGNGTLVRSAPPNRRSISLIPADSKIFLYFAIEMMTADVLPSDRGGRVMSQQVIPDHVELLTARLTYLFSK